MKQTKTWDASQLRPVFRKARTRFTTQREAIWRFFARSPGGFTITDAVAKLKAKGIGLATVYRTVTLLEKLDLLRHVHDKGLEHRFIATQPGHFHPLVCRSCGHVVEFDACGLSAVERSLSAKTGFHVEGHYVEIYGTCAECTGGRK
jgi:Fe2+ or Zn2+ uptake regulation protein